MGEKKKKMLHDIECCEVEEIHEDKVQMVSEQMPPEDSLYDLAELFKAFGDTTRIRSCGFSGDDPVCNLASAAASETGPARERAPGG